MLENNLRRSEEDLSDLLPTNDRFLFEDPVLIILGQVCTDHGQAIYVSGAMENTTATLHPIMHSRMQGINGWEPLGNRWLHMSFFTNGSGIM
jgi:hypothetical protein